MQLIQSQKLRFSGIPNNGTLELVELSQEEIGKEEKVIFLKRDIGEAHYHDRCFWSEVLLTIPTEGICL